MDLTELFANIKMAIAAFNEGLDLMGLVELIEGILTGFEF